MEVCSDVKLNVANLLRANREYIDKHLQLRVGRFGDVYINEDMGVEE